MSADPERDESPGPAATLYLAPEAFGLDRAELEGDTYRHLFRSRRLAAGDWLRIVDGLGHARVGKVDSVERRRATLALGERLKTHEPTTQLRMLVAAPKPERAAWLVEKATELGVASVGWLQSQRGPRALGPGVLARQRRISISALQQCGGSRLPEISGPHDWHATVERLEGATEAWVLDREGTHGPPQAATGTTTLLIGPEGGWTPLELETFEGLGVGRWSLGDRTLRIETAAIVACGLLLGDRAR